MIFDLDIIDLVNMIKGTTPSYKLMDHEDIKDKGHFSASYGRWDWNYDALIVLPEEKLVEIYHMLKHES